MKAMVLRQCGPIDSNPLRCEELPDPVPDLGQVRVRVRACGICRTDLHVIEGDLPHQTQPIIPGHQVIGTVDLLGPGTKRYSVGQRIGIAWLHQSCGICSYCLQGHENLCTDPLFTGYQRPGGFSEYCVVPEDFAYAIPDTFSDMEAAPLLCAGIIGYRSLKRSGCQPGSTLALFGFGSSAHIVIQIAQHWNCKVYVCSRNLHHQQLALELGASWAGSNTQGMPSRVQHAIIFAPAGNLVPEALESLDRGGTLALAGIYMSAIPEMNYEKHLFYERNVGSVTANTRQDGEELLRIAAAIPIRPQTQVFDLLEANRALRLLKLDQIRGSGILVPGWNANPVMDNTRPAN
ncbi:MAG TPA: alcohol dehydrogenase [Syntrophobacteraceae bacterium]|nr:alcohol dehydrogenase [Syntrophobacteraceae bacterium]